MTARLLADYLTFTPTPREVACFEADMRTMNRVLLSHAITEATEIRKRPRDELPASEQRVEIHRIYARKVKEIAALYPIIFAVENGLRGSLAAFLSTHFRREDWWLVVRDAVLGGIRHSQFQNICGEPISRDFIRQIFFTIGNIDDPSSSRRFTLSDVNEIYDLMTLGELTRLIVTDWDRCGTLFQSNSENKNGLKLEEFKKRMNILRDARNDAFHSKPVKDRNGVFRAAEFVLHQLNFHLGDFDTDLMNATYSRPQPQTERVESHVVPARPLRPIRPTPAT